MTGHNGIGSDFRRNPGDDADWPWDATGDHQLLDETAGNIGGGAVNQRMLAAARLRLAAAHNVQASPYGAGRIGRHGVGSMGSSHSGHGVGIGIGGMGSLAGLPYSAAAAAAATGLPSMGTGVGIGGHGIGGSIGGGIGHSQRRSRPTGAAMAHALGAWHEANAFQQQAQYQDLAIAQAQVQVQAQAQQRAFQRQEWLSRTVVESRLSQATQHQTAILNAITANGTSVGEPSSSKDGSDSVSGNSDHMNNKNNRSVGAAGGEALGEEGAHNTMIKGANKTSGAAFEGEELEVQLAAKESAEAATNSGGGDKGRQNPLAFPTTQIAAAAVGSHYAKSAALLAQARALAMQQQQTQTPTQRGSTSGNAVGTSGIVGDTTTAETTTTASSITNTSPTKNRNSNTSNFSNHSRIGGGTKKGDVITIQDSSDDEEAPTVPPPKKEQVSLIRGGSHINIHRTLLEKRNAANAAMDTNSPKDTSSCSSSRSISPTTAIPLPPTNKQNAHGNTASTAELSSKSSSPTKLNSKRLKLNPSSIPFDPPITTTAVAASTPTVTATATATTNPFSSRMIDKPNQKTMKLIHSQSNKAKSKDLDLGPIGPITTLAGPFVEGYLRNKYPENNMDLQVHEATSKIIYLATKKDISHSKSDMSKSIRINFDRVEQIAAEIISDRQSVVQEAVRSAFRECQSRHDNLIVQALQQSSQPETKHLKKLPGNNTMDIATLKKNDDTATATTATGVSGVIDAVAAAATTGSTTSGSNMLGDKRIETIEELRTNESAALEELRKVKEQHQQEIERLLMSHQEQVEHLKQKLAEDRRNQSRSLNAYMKASVSSLRLLRKKSVYGALPSSSSSNTIPKGGEQ